MPPSCRPPSPRWSTEPCSGSSPGSAFLQLLLPPPALRAGAQGALVGPCSDCSQVGLISDSSEPSPKGGELVSVLIAGLMAVGVL